MLWYKNVQFIAYSIDTKPDYANGRYLARSVPSDDVDTRVAIMEAAVDEARANASTSTYCLKVFVAPEFFFRSRTGAYDLDAYQRVLSGLHAWASDAQYEHWVFFFGTIITTFLAENGDREILNVALVEKGGGGERKAVIKENLLEGDLLRNAQIKPGSDPNAITFENVVGVKSGDDFYAARNRGNNKELQAHGFDGTSIFDLAGVRFAVEICADHMGGRLIESPTGRFTYHPQLQVITSCGTMGIIDRSVVASQGGYVFLSDGFFADTVNGMRSELGRVTTAKPSKDDGATIANVVIASATSMAGKLPGHWAKCFAAPGEVRLYPAQALPWAKQRWF